MRRFWNASIPAFLPEAVSEPLDSIPPHFVPSSHSSPVLNRPGLGDPPGEPHPIPPSKPAARSRGASCAPLPSSGRFPSSAHVRIRSRLSSSAAPNSLFVLKCRRSIDSNSRLPLFSGAISNLSRGQLRRWCPPAALHAVDRASCGCVSISEA